MHMNKDFWIEMVKKWSTYSNNKNQDEAINLAIEHAQREKSVKSAYSINLFDDEEDEDEY